MLSDAKAIDETDLLRHCQVRVQVYDDDAVWVGDVTGDDPTKAIVTLGFKNLTFFGELPDVLDRFRAAVRVLEDAAEHPAKWDLLLPRRYRRGNRELRTWPHPFLDPPRPAPPV
jgi:hypothetical protein